MKIPLIYNVRSIMQRPASTVMTAVSIGLVVAVFIAMLALATGFRAALAKTGSKDNVIVLRQGAQDELSSGIGRETARLIATFPHVAMGDDGKPLVSPEIYVLLNPDRKTGGIGNVVARGVDDRAFGVRHGVRIVAGRKFNTGASEVIIGQRIAERFVNMDVGDTLEFGGRKWAVVGHFASDGSGFESEVWGENEQFMPVFRGEVYQSVIFRLAPGATLDEVKRAMESDPRMQVSVREEQDFYTSQSGILSTTLKIMAVFISAIMSVGAIFGAVNTMYAAVASRAPEIAVMLTLGFKPRSVMVSFLSEAAMIALIGGLLGCLFALPVNGIATSTTNWQSFSEVAFAFRVTPTLLFYGVVFAVVMGVLGGFLPAWRAARLPVIQALR